MTLFFTLHGIATCLFEIIDSRSEADEKKSGPVKSTVQMGGILKSNICFFKFSMM